MFTSPLSVLTSSGGSDVRNEARGEIPDQCVSAARARSVLGWQARYTREQGLAETIEWYRENGAWIEKVRNPAYREYYKAQYPQITPIQKSDL